MTSMTIQLMNGVTNVAMAGIIQAESTNIVVRMVTPEVPALGSGNVEAEWN